MKKPAITNFKREILFLSSGKAKEFANKVRHELLDRIQNTELLKDGYECICWDNRRVFKKNDSVFHNLLEYAQRLKQSDGYAICVFYPDDILYRDGDENNSRLYVPRDNVIFELGLFYGVLGKNNTYFLICNKANGIILHNPSDLDGISGFTYNWDDSGNSPAKGEERELAVNLVDMILDNIKQAIIQEPTFEKEIKDQNTILHNNENDIKEIHSSLDDHCHPEQLLDEKEQNQDESEMLTTVVCFPKPLTRGIDPR